MTEISAQRHSADRISRESVLYTMCCMNRNMLYLFVSVWIRSPLTCALKSSALSLYRLWQTSSNLRERGGRERERESEIHTERETEGERERERESEIHTEREWEREREGDGGRERERERERGRRRERDRGRHTQREREREIQRERERESERGERGRRREREREGDTARESWRSLLVKRSVCFVSWQLISLNWGSSCNCIEALSPWHELIEHSQADIDMTCILYLHRLTMHLRFPCMLKL